MHTTYALTRELQKKLGINSAYALANHLGCSQSAAKRWTKKQATFDDETSILIAEELGLDPAYVIACANAERAQSQAVKRHYQRMAEMAERAAKPESKDAADAA